MRAFKSIIYSFLLGGLLAFIAQGFSTIWNTVLPGTPMEFFIGGATLVSMGVIGFTLAGFAVYQRFEEWATFGALLPFSGFSMAVGMKILTPWTKGESLGKCLWAGGWLCIWFNIVGCVTCIGFGYLCTVLGADPMVPAKNTSLMVYPAAFFMGGLICVFFQICFLVAKAITPKAKPLWILLLGWMMGAICAPFGLSGTLANVFGQGFSIMIPIGGYNMYNVGVSLAMGEVGEALVHYGAFLLAVVGLFLCGLFTFIIYNAKFGRTPIHTVHVMQAQRSIDELVNQMPPSDNLEGLDYDIDPEIIEAVKRAESSQQAVKLPA